MKPILALATIADSRDDYYTKREWIVQEESSRLAWLDCEATVLRSPVIRRREQALTFATEAKKICASALIIHVPIWADPEFAARIAVCLPLPTLVLGNARTDSSSTVGLLGVCGALDQLGHFCIRVPDGTCKEGIQAVSDFLRAAYALASLPGRTMLRFGDCSLGILTANPDSIAWQKELGLFIKYAEQRELIEAAEQLPDVDVHRHTDWLFQAMGDIHFGDAFTPAVLERQVRSYLATRALAKKYGADFIGVKCQDELSDGYTVQCLAHALMNGTIDADGEKAAVVHACESDANGALTMYLLHLLSAGAPVSLIDVRYVDTKSGEWILANCGSMPADHFQPCGQNCLSGISMRRHAFGKACGGCCTGYARPGPVTMARLCYRDGQYWMAIVSGEILPMDSDTRAKVPAEFPVAHVQTQPLPDFLQNFGSNHIHIAYGNWVHALKLFCQLKHWNYRIW